MPPARPFFLSVLPYFLSVLPFFLSLLPTFLSVYLSFGSCSMLFPVDAFCVIQAWRGFWDVIVFFVSMAAFNHNAHADVVSKLCGSVVASDALCV